MKKSIFLFIIAVLALSFSKAQVSADSLVGTYVGKYWYADQLPPIWYISSSTAYISNIDSVNCTLYIYNGGGKTSRYYTDYFSCNNPAPVNRYIKFYAGDSLKTIYDSTNSPSGAKVSMRFFGKRISCNSGIHELTKNYEINIYPNPFTDRLNFKLSEKLPDVSLYFYDVYSRLLTYINIISGDEFTLYMKLLPKGIYFYRLTSKNNIVKTGKVIKD